MIEITANDLTFPPDHVTPAASRKSKIVGRKIRLMIERSYQTAIRQPRKIVRDELSQIYVNFRQPNWDGYNASPITAETFFAAKSFFELLQDSINVPEVMADPDGDIAFEWNNKDNSLTVAVNSTGHIAFAGYFRDNATIHGSEAIDDSAVETVERLIDRVYRD